MAAEHTPGPFTVMAEDLRGGLDGPPCIPIVARTEGVLRHRLVCEVVATMVENEGDVSLKLTDEDRANAALLQAAPEMLAELRMIASVLVSRPEDGASYVAPLSVERCARIKALIIRAEGRA